nr:immunoglobulin heavy chain junction region [Mus musculus]
CARTYSNPYYYAMDYW